MKKLVLFLAAVMILAVTGCKTNDEVSIDNQTVIDEKSNNRKNFFHNGDTYTAELFVEMANTHEGILSGKKQQAYIFDLRSEEKYNKGHIIGSINMNFSPDEAEELIEKIPSDWLVYIIGETDKTAKEMASRLKAIDELLFVYVIEGGYDALARAEGIDKYITTESGVFTDFTRTKNIEKFNSITSSIPD